MTTTLEPTQLAILLRMVKGVEIVWTPSGSLRLSDTREKIAVAAFDALHHARYIEAIGSVESEGEYWRITETGKKALTLTLEEAARSELFS